MQKKTITITITITRNQKPEKLSALYNKNCNIKIYALNKKR